MVTVFRKVAFYGQIGSSCHHWLGSSDSAPINCEGLSLSLR